MARKILLLTHCFAPYGFAESYLSVKRMGNIPNYVVDVLTIHAVEPWIKKDNEFFMYANEKFNNIKQIDCPDFYKKLPFNRLESFFSIPDKYVYMNLAYIKYLKNLRDYDALVTWSMYHSVHLLGYWMKRRNAHLPWIAHFSDPWTTNPFIKKRGYVVNKINKILEKKVFSSSDLLLFTSEETRDDCLRHYPEKLKCKSLVVPHAFDQNLYPLIDQPNTYPIKISHIGNFYGERNPASFLQALKILEEREPNLVTNVQVHFIGASQNSINVSEFSYVTVEDSVDYITSLKKMLESNLLLVIDAPFEPSPFLSSKLIDYIGANKPIFGITPLGTSQKLIEEMGFLTAHPSRPEEIANKLSITIQAIKEKKIPSIPPSIRERYSVATIGAEMKKILDNIISNNKEAVISPRQET